MPVGAPLGNQNAANGARWEKAITRALAHKAGSADDGLFAIAQEIVSAALDSDAPIGLRTAAWQEIGNRMDGKPHQTVAAALSADITVVRRVFGKGRDAA